jgi:hypothetical protein
MGIAIGAYLFNSNVRKSVNKIIMNLFTSLMSYMRTGKMSKQLTAKRTATSVQRNENVGYRTNGAVKSLKSVMQCNDCGGVLIPADGQFKGFGVCSQCQAIQPIK